MSGTKITKAKSSPPIFTGCVCVPTPLRFGGGADRIPFYSMCVFTPDAADLRSVTGPAIWSCLEKISRTSISAGYQMQNA